MLLTLSEINNKQNKRKQKKIKKRKPRKQNDKIILEAGKSMVIIIGIFCCV